MESNVNNEELEIDLVALFMELLRRWWIIFLAGLLFAAAGFGISKFIIKPTYESTTAVYVVNKQDGSSISYSDLQLGTQLTKDYIVLAKSRTVMEKVISELGLDMTVEELKNSISISSASDTRIMYITVTYTDPAMAQKIADSVRNNAAEHIKKVMNVEEINVAEEANFPMKKSAPSISKWTVLGGALGVFLAAGIIALLFLLNDKLKTPDDIEKYLGLSTLASIPYCEILEKAGVLQGDK